jgi:hypothetical protein
MDDNIDKPQLIGEYNPYTPLESSTYENPGCVNSSLI